MKITFQTISSIENANDYDDEAGRQAGMEWNKEKGIHKQKAIKLNLIFFTV